LLFVQCTLSTHSDNYVHPYLEGVNSMGKMPDKPYLTAGDKSYIIGTQDGLFPDLGNHVRGEMGGIWTHPIKLADGFWLKITDANHHNEAWLMASKDYYTYPFGSKFVYESVLKDIDVVRFQFAPDNTAGVSIAYTITNRSESARDLKVDFFLKTDISPVWFSRENNIFDYADIVSWDKEHSVFTAKDSVNNWFAVWGTSASGDGASYSIDDAIPFTTTGNGKTGLISNVIKLRPKQQITVNYAIAGSINSNKEAQSTYNTLLSRQNELLDKKKASFVDILQRSKINIPDKKLETAYNWVKINTRWLEMDLDGYGRFQCAGAVEYPWLFGCDNSYALQGVLAAGNFELAKSTLTILKNVSDRENGNGRIIHEMSTNGFVSNKGNTQETSHYIVAVWKTFQWTGDLDFLKSLYPYIKQGIQWLTVEMDKNQNLFPEGYGIMEVRGLDAELIDVAVYTQQALEAASQMALILGESNVANEFKAKAIALKNKINDECWDEVEGSYCDFYGTREQAMKVAQGAIEQLGNSNRTEEGNLGVARFYQSLIERFGQFSQGEERGWFTNKNWVINTPMETGIAPVEKAIRNLDKIRNEHCGEYGPFLSAVERRHMMTIATGVQAMSEARYGRIDECLWYVNKIASTLGLTLPGSINEMMPDYGCPAQGWTIYGITTPLITYVFGVTPDAFNKQLVIEPQLPSGWDTMSLENQRVGNNIYNIKINRKDGQTTYEVTSKEKDWNTVLRIKHLTGKEYSLNGKKTIASTDEIVLKGAKNTTILPDL